MLFYVRSFVLISLMCPNYQAIPSPNGSSEDPNTSTENSYVRNLQESNGIWSWLGGWCSTAHNYLLGDKGLITSYIPSFMPGWKKKSEVRRCCCEPKGESTTVSSDTAMEVRSVGEKLKDGAGCFLYFWYNLGEGTCKFVKYTTLAIGDKIMMECEKRCGCFRRKSKQSNNSGK